MVGLAAISLCMMLIALVVQSAYPANEGRWILLAFLGHYVAAFAFVLIYTYSYGTGDVFLYYQSGQNHALELHRDFMGTIGYSLRVFLQLESDFITSNGISMGNTTNSVCVLSGWAAFVLGESIYAVSVAFSLMSLLGQLGIYAAFRRVVPASMRETVLLTTLLLPSTVFWTSSMVKEGVAITGIGMFIYGLAGTERSFLIRRGLAIGMGLLLLYLIKPYLLFASAIATGAWWYMERAAGRGEDVPLRPLPLLGAGAGTFAGLQLLGWVFPRFSLSQVAQSAATQQSYILKTKAGSGYMMGDPDSTSILGQAAFAPFALFTAWYRPLLIEAYNPQMLMSAVETTGFLAATVYIAARRRPMEVVRHITRSPMLTYAAVFSLILGVVTGLASGNLGTLVRYRAPMLSFFALLLVVSAQEARAPRRTPQSAKGGPPGPSAIGRVQPETGRPE